VNKAVRPEDARPPEIPAADRAEILLEDLLAAPDELALVLDHHARAVAALPEDVFEHPRWRLLGMGSSRFAALDAATHLRAAGLDAAAEHASASSPSEARGDTVAVLISNSGRTAEVVEAADRHRGGSYLIAVTGDPASPLATRADAVIPLVADRAESSGIASLSYRSTVAALTMLADRAAGRTPGAGTAAAVPALETLLAGRASWLSSIADVLDGDRPVHVLIDAARIGLAEQAALMLREAPRISAQAFDTGDWLHTGLYTLLPGDPVLLFVGAASDEAAVATADARGGRVVSVGRAVKHAVASTTLTDAVLDEPEVRSLVESAVAELIAVELWQRATAEMLSEDRSVS
jgi:glucosamine--fructose-6-phosphate aminotransferase (isomerizing)